MTDVKDTNSTDGSVWQEQLALQEILEGTSADLGEDFFQSLTVHLARAMGVKYAFLAEFTEVKTRVRTLAFWAEDKHVGPVEFDLAGTPCEDVFDGSMCHHPDQVADRFPSDRSLKDRGIRSYLGVPLVDDAGEVLGHLAVADTKPMPDEPRGMSIFRIFASRAGAELRRLNAEAECRESSTRFAGILSGAMDAIVIVDSSLTVSIFNKAAERTFRCEAGDVIGTSLGRFLTPAFKSAVEQTTQRGCGENEPLWAPEGFTAIRADGDEFPVEATLSPVNVADECLYALILRDVNDRKHAEAQVERLHLENQYLQEELKSTYDFEEIVGGSKEMQTVFHAIEQVAETDATVLVNGETGTGKELIARAIHNRSDRRDKPLIKVNCAALPTGLVESELFGHEKGAFTGAIEKRIGRFELADGGTLFLDEIGEIEPEVQVRLLRVLQEQEFERIGSGKTIRVDVRVIAATNRDLEKEVDEGRFRKDLFYRLNVFPLALPALRDRMDDIALLASHFVEKYSAKLGRRVDRIDASSLERLASYSWPGNIRELENVVERAVILASGPVLSISPQGEARTQPETEPGQTLDEIQRAHIVQVLDQTGWRVEGESGAATILGMHPNTLRSRMKKLEIARDATG